MVDLFTIVFISSKLSNTFLAEENIIINQYNIETKSWQIQFLYQKGHKQPSRSMHEYTTVDNYAVNYLKQIITCPLAIEANGGVT